VDRAATRERGSYGAGSQRARRATPAGGTPDKRDKLAPETDQLAVVSELAPIVYRATITEPRPLFWAFEDGSGKPAAPANGPIISAPDCDGAPPGSCCRTQTPRAASAPCATPRARLYDVASVTSSRRAERGCRFMTQTPGDLPRFDPEVVQAKYAEERRK